jgi:flagellar basal-body rod protein FlgC
MTSLFKSMQISSSGLAAQRLRMNVLSSNLANVETTRTPEGGPYKRKDVVFSAVPAGPAFEDFLNETEDGQLQKVQVTQIHEDQQEAKRVFEPGHPDADKSGYVRKPNIQVMTEMVNMIAATRAYEANATALNEAKSMAVKALELGK